MHFESPWAFLLLILIPALPLIRRFTLKRGAIRFSSTGNAAKAGSSFRRRLYQLPAVIRLLALVCLVVALARPQTGREQIVDVSKGIAIEMVIDRSGSMGAEMEFEGRQMTRLDVVKNVFKNFALGDGKDLKGRSNDLIGMIAFAGYPDTICPLTLAHGALPPFLDTIKLVQVRSEDGTAIGDALALAAARLEKADETLTRQRPGNKKIYEIKSKIIILLSDGENNAGKRDPLQAADLAAKWGIKVYAIAVGGGESVQSVQTPFGVFKVPVSQRVDTMALKQIAEKTGGFFREATDADSLSAIYKEIDQMETSEIESIKFVDYKESFLPFAMLGLMLIGLEILLSNTIFRKIP
ncbi:MAG: aerotolerance regulator BatA [Desulfobacterales bacterium CG23_combo_of_CG06-09_8_20_14_all_51_8]|nr:MAG: aerotolerance regulator BatA [Desulfobacterales bacterium CG23_combo_of_CG06-09_8_20_14_all_51_8]